MERTLVLLSYVPATVSFYLKGYNELLVYCSGDNGAGPTVSCPLALTFPIMNRLLPKYYRYLQGFSLTIFQSLAFAAGYDPITGPGSSCSAESSSGQCVLPWAGGTKRVSSVVLVASGVSFAVWPSLPQP